MVVDIMCKCIIPDMLQIEDTKARISASRLSHTHWIATHIAAPKNSLQRGR